MASLPPEIWLQIIEWLDYDKPVKTSDHTALENLSLASSSLRSLTQPVTFRSLTISIQPNNLEKTESRLNGLLHLIRTRPECTQWFKMFFCTDWVAGSDYGGTTSPNYGDRFNNLIALVFVQLPALTHISMSDIKITPQMISHIHQLPNLCDVGLYEVGLPPSSEFRERCAGLVVSTSISKLRINGGRRRHPAARSLVSIPTIRTLSLSGASSMQLILDVIQADPLFTFPNLSSLHLSFEPVIDSLFDNPTLFSNLTSLSIFGSDYSWDTLPVPHPSALKMLKQFGGPLVVAALILPGRPVNDVYIHSADEPHVLSGEMLSSINTSQSMLRRLSVRYCVWSNGCLALVGELFPGLEYLGLFEITGDYMSWLVEHLCEEFQGLLHLQTLALTTAYSIPSQNVSREVQARMLSRLGSSGPPKLRVVELGGTMWRLDNQGHWASASLVNVLE